MAQFTDVAVRNARVAAGTALSTHIAVHTNAATSAAGTEPSGGSPAYARKATSWSTASGGAQSTTQTHDIPSGTTVTSLGGYSALTAGTWRFSIDVTSQAFSSQGTYTSTISDTNT